MIVAIDDARLLQEADIVLRNMKAAIAFFDAYESDKYSRYPYIFDDITEIWLDHDLGMQLDCTDTIRPLMCRFEEPGPNQELYKNVTFHIITANPTGRDWMVAALRNYDKVKISFKEW